MNDLIRTRSSFSHEGIDTYALLKIIAQQKIIIAVVTALTVLIAYIYCLLAPVQYQVSSVLRPAALNELDALNRSEVYKLPPNDALSKVGGALESYETRLGFFLANQSLFQKFDRPGRSLEHSFEEFNRDSVKLSLSDPKRTESGNGYITVELSYPEDVDGVAILNGLVSYAISAEREQIEADLKVIVTNRLNELKGKIDAARSNYETEKDAKIAFLLEADGVKRAQLQDELKALRQQLKTRRNDRITQLNEAITIAESLGIRKPTSPSALADVDGSISSSVLRVGVTNQQVPLYFLGVEALDAERRVLQHRMSDDFTEARIAQITKELSLLQSNHQVEILAQRKNEDMFLSDIQSLRAEAVRLRNLDIDISRINLVTIDRQALTPLAPVKPKKSIIIVLAVILGVVLGSVLVLIRHSLVVRQSPQLSAANVVHDSISDDRSLISGT
ncbi:GNVR domain-containing protein [Pseudomonas sp. LB3P81]